jgi:competence protein ComEC
MRGRVLALVIALPVFFPQRIEIDPQAFRLTVFDVGQGLSVLVETRSHRLLYDTGPAFAAGSDAAELAVLPALRHRGIDALDMLMVSHRDSDHAGGTTSILAELAVSEVVVGERLELPQQQVCTAGQRWQWDGVWFTVLNPPAATVASTAGNNRSCVLRVESGAASALLTGDIEAPVEARLVRAGLSPATVLIAPHHGSRTSSSPLFVAALQPRRVVFSAGYRNAFGHPHPQVAERYRAAGAQALNSADSGAITLTLQRNGVVEITEYRKDHRHYWDEQ